jgi:hypothetical protein
MGMYAATSDTDLADIAAYVNATRYGKSLTNSSGVLDTLPFALTSNGVPIAGTSVVLPEVMLGSTGQVLTMLLISAPASGSLTVSALQNNAATPNAFSISTTNTLINKCPALPFTLTTGQSCTLNVVMLVTSPGAFDGKLVTQVNGVASPVTLNGSVSAQATGGEGGGGCTMRSAPGMFDPVLLLLSALSLAVLGLRRKKKSKV